MALIDRPLLTEQFSQVEDFVPEKGAVYIYGEGEGFEERNDHLAKWRAKTSDVSFVRVVKQEEMSVSYEAGTDVRQAPLRGRALGKLWSQTTTGPLYIDLTGLQHHVWAPILRAAIEAGRDVRVVYVEPLDYSFSSAPTEGDIFALSVKSKGVAPLPGFARFVDFSTDVCFVPCLGFEGNRFGLLLEHVQAPRNRILPIIGVPGFRQEYPFHTYHGNRTMLMDTGGWKRARYVPADCPFRLFYCLEEVAEEYSTSLLKIAPIGTKPHALGGVLFAISQPSRVELVYDHPIRKSDRTAGSARLHVYHVGKFLQGRASAS